MDLLTGKIATYYWEKIGPLANSTKLIAGGMIKSQEEIRLIVETGFDAITTSDKSLWIEGYRTVQ